MGLSKLKVLEKSSSTATPALRRLVDRISPSSPTPRRPDASVTHERTETDEERHDKGDAHAEDPRAQPGMPRRLSTAATPPRGGLVFDDPDDRALAERQRDSIRFIASRFGSQLLSRSPTPISLRSTIMPVHLNEPRSFLQRLTDDFVYADYFLTAAAAAVNNPVRRLSFVAAFLVSALHCSANMAKSFNPHIGETFQATYGSDDKLSHIFLEQTRHHPPVSHFVAHPPDQSYMFSGYASFDSQVRFSETSLYTRRTGVNVVHFHDDNSRIVFFQPQQVIRGLLGSDRRIEVLGPCSLYYEKYQLVFDILFDPPQPFMLFGAKAPSDRLRGVLYRLKNDSQVAFSGAFDRHKTYYFGNPDEVGSVVSSPSGEDRFVKQPIELRPDKDIYLSVVSAWNEKTKEAKRSKVFEEEMQSSGLCRNVIAYSSGSFVSHLDVGGTRFWDLDTPKGKVQPVPLHDALPSDSRHRPDIQALQLAISDNSSSVPEGKGRADLLDIAQTSKEQLEDQMRAESRLRRLKEDCDDTFFPKSIPGIAPK